MPVTTYHVTRDTANDCASDEDRAMAHVAIYKGDDLSDAQFHLQQALLDEAKGLIRGREITVARDVWAFKRAAALAELAAEAIHLDPNDDPAGNRPGYARIARETEGLLFAITAVNF